MMQPKQPGSVILMVGYRFPGAGESMTGTPAHIAKLAKSIRSRGMNVCILGLDGSGVDNADDYRVCKISHLLWKVPLLLKKYKPAVIHCHGHIPALLMLPFAKILGLPIICELHGLYVASKDGVGNARPLLSATAARLEYFALRFSSHVITQSQAMRSRVVNILKISEQKTSVFYPGLDIGEFTCLPKTPLKLDSLDDRDVVVMYIGSTFSFQGLDLLAAAEKIYRKKRPIVKTVLVLSGDESTHSSVLLKYGFDIERVIVIAAGNGRLIPQYCRRADMLVHARTDCPDNINVQSKLGLYLASGKPIVATNVGDYRSLLGESRGCKLVNPDASELASAIISSIGDTEMIESAVNENIVLAKKYFDISKNTDGLMDLYRKLVCHAVLH